MSPRASIRALGRKVGTRAAVGVLASLVLIAAAAITVHHAQAGGGSVGDVSSPATGTSSPDATGQNGQSGKNVIVEVNTHDGKTESKTGLSVKHESGDVYNTNAAAATSSCNECRTVAVAVQVVLVTGSPSNVVPQNLALAFNDQCHGCETMASAYQYVLQTDGEASFTSTGNNQIATIDNEIKDAAGSSLSLPDLDARLDALVSQLWSVVNEQLKIAGVHGTGTPEKRKDVEVTPDQSTPSPTPSGGSSGTSGPTPSQSPSTTPTSTPSDTTSPEPSPTPS